MPERLYEIGVVASFEAAHRLHGDFGPAVRPHGHTYRVEVALAGDELSEDGSLFDLGALQSSLDAAVGPLHYQDLDALPIFSGRNTTAEVVAEHIHAELVRLLSGRLVSHLVTVRVWESDRVWAAYRAPLSP